MHPTETHAPPAAHATDDPQLQRLLLRPSQTWPDAMGADERCDKLRGIVGDLLLALQAVGERTRGDAVAATAVKLATERAERQLERLGYGRR
jgi:hypothetical protein